MLPQKANASMTNVQKCTEIRYFGFSFFQAGPLVGSCYTRCNYCLWKMLSWEAAGRRSIGLQKKLQIFRRRAHKLIPILSRCTKPKKVRVHSLLSIRCAATAASFGDACMHERVSNSTNRRRRRPNLKRDEFRAIIGEASRRVLTKRNFPLTSWRSKGRRMSFSFPSQSCKYVRSGSPGSK